MFNIFKWVKSFFVTSPTDIIFTLINKERQKRNLKPLKKDSVLMKAASNYANLMAQRKKLSHNLDGDTGKRIEKTGYHWSWWGENIGWNYGPEQMVNAWINSPGHRGNILNSHFEDTGIGVVNLGNGTYYCQIFGKKLYF